MTLIVHDLISMLENTSAFRQDTFPMVMVKEASELTDEEIARIATTYHAWRGEKEAGPTH